MMPRDASCSSSDASDLLLLFLSREFAPRSLSYRTSPRSLSTDVEYERDVTGLRSLAGRGLACLGMMALLNLR